MILFHNSAGFPDGSQSGSIDFDCLGGASSSKLRLLLLTASWYDLRFSFLPLGAAPVRGDGFMSGRERGGKVRCEEDILPL